MDLALHTDPLPMRLDDTGTLRIGDSRVTLDALLQYWHLGMSAEEIARGLDTLSLADVHGALAYYLRHQAELDEYLQGREKEAEELRCRIESANATQLASVKAKLHAARDLKETGAFVRRS